MFTYYVHCVVQAYPWCNWVFSFVLVHGYLSQWIQSKEKIPNCAKGKIELQHTYMYYINTWHFPLQFALKTWTFIKWLTPDFKNKTNKQNTHTLIPLFCKYFYIHIYQVVNVMYLCSCQCTKPKCNNNNCTWHKYLYWYFSLAFDMYLYISVNTLTALNLAYTFTQRIFCKPH